MQLLVLFVSAFLIRLINLNQSLWLDESVTAKVASSIPFHLIPTSFSPADVHPPLYYMFISLWSSIFGTSEIALRMPSVLFSLVAGWYVYKIGGKWAAALFLFNPLIIYYAQEARMHMMATMLLSTALYHFLQVLKKSPQDLKKKYSFLHNNILLFNLFSALALGVFYGSGFFIGAMILMAIGRDLRGRGVGQWTMKSIYLSIGLVSALVILSPLLYHQLLNSKAGLAELTNWSNALGNVDLKNLALFPLKFATGRLSWLPKWSYYLVAGVPTLITWLVVAIGMKKNKILAALLILPLLFGMFVSIIAPMMMYFRFLYLVPVMCLLMSSVIPAKEGLLPNGRIQTLISNQKKNIFDWIPASAGMTQKSNLFILFSFIIFSLVYLTRPQFHREDWKSAAKELNSSIPLYMIIPSSDPIAYYRSDVSVFELRTLSKNRIPEMIQVIPYTSDLYGVDYTSLLQKSGCVKESQASFRGDVVVERWKCLRNA